MFLKNLRGTACPVLPTYTRKIKHTIPSCLYIPVKMCMPSISFLVKPSITLKYFYLVLLYERTVPQLLIMFVYNSTQFNKQGL